MKMQWCWRCKMEVPMLDEEEAATAKKLFFESFHNRNAAGDLLSRFNPLLDYYNKLSGWNETNPNAVMHLFIDSYGPPCEKCGKPYRTPLASFCAACGNKRQ